MTLCVSLCDSLCVSLHLCVAYVLAGPGASVRCLDPLDSNDAAKYRERDLAGSKRLVLIQGLTAQVATAQELVLSPHTSSIDAPFV